MRKVFATLTTIHLQIHNSSTNFDSSKQQKENNEGAQRLARRGERRKRDSPSKAQGKVNYEVGKNKKNKNGYWEEIIIAAQLFAMMS